MPEDHVLYLSLNGETGSHLEEQLQQANVGLRVALNVRHAQEELMSGKYSVFVNRCDEPCDAIFELLRFMGQHGLRTRLIMSSRLSAVEEAVQVMKAGAHDVLVSKRLDKELANSVIRCISHQKKIIEMSSQVAQSQAVQEETILVGQSPAVNEIRSAVSLVASSKTSVLITGESGTGKEIIARLIHRQSTRANRPFIALNCAALPKDIMENELFGHQKGAFTGAMVKKAGYFEMADGGTLFLDEIAEMSSETQAKLLRAIEQQSFRRLGGREELAVDVRTVAATNQDISAALKSGRLREDLYYRLSVIEIYTPPLRERKDDIPLLVAHFLSVFGDKYGKPRQRFSDECSDMLLAWDWLGNIRELRNVIERAVVLCPDGVITSSYLPQRISPIEQAQTHINIPLGTSTQDAERMIILQTLASVGNNKSKAARILGLSRKTLHNKLQIFSQEQV